MTDDQDTDASPDNGQEPTADAVAQPPATAAEKPAAVDPATATAEARRLRAYKPLDAYIRVRNFLLGAAVLGLVLPLIFALQAGSALEKLAIGAIGIGIFAAAMTVGGLIGFVFGIPTSLQNTRTPAIAPASGGTTSAADTPPALYVANTSLEQISDWLTKILVGVGLTQLASIPTGLAQLGEFLAGGLGNLPGATVFAPALVVFGLLEGFYLSYLWTRLNLPHLFAESEWLQRLSFEREEGFKAGESRAFEATASASERAKVEGGRAEGERAALDAAAAAAAGAGAATGPEPKPGTGRRPTKPPSEGVAPGAMPITPTPASPDLVALWVDDRPDNNVTER